MSTDERSGEKHKKERGREGGMYHATSDYLLSWRQNRIPTGTYHSIACSTHPINRRHTACLGGTTQLSQMPHFRIFVARLSKGGYAEEDKHQMAWEWNLKPATEAMSLS